MATKIKENAPSLPVFQQVVEHLSTPIFIKNQRHQWIYVNQAFCDLLGYTQKELLGKHEAVIGLTANHYATFQQERLLFKHQQPVTNTVVWTNRGREKYHVLLKNSILKGGKNELYLVGTIEKVAPIKPKSDAISKILSKTILDHLPYFVLVVNTMGVCEYINSAVENLLDISADDCIGKTMTVLKQAGIDLECFIKNLSLTQTTPIYDYKSVAQNPNTGEIVWIATSTIPVKNRANQLDYFLLVGTDITAMIHTETAYRKQERLFRIVLDNIPQYAFWKDRNSIYMYSNKNFAKATGFDKPFDLIGRTDYDLYRTKEEADFYRNEDRGIMEKGVPKYSIERKQLKADGTEMWVSANKVPMKDETGRVIGILGTYEDITKRKIQEIIIQKQINTLNEKNKELERYIASNMQLENFAYIASHDLKAPIRTILSFSKLLKKALKDNWNHDVKEYLTFIVSASQNMKLLIDDLLNYSLVRNQHYAFEKIDSMDFLCHIIINLQANIAEKQAIIEAGELPRFIYGDEVKLRQLFQNLIANAIKFHRPNVAPVVKIHCESHKNHWQFAIEDNGIGISPQFHEKIFLLFRKLHTNRKYQGTGIGLALCKTVVEQHGGKIWLTSKCDKGTTFYFTIAKQQ